MQSSSRPEKNRIPIDRVRRVRDAALERLIECQESEGSWRLPILHGGMAAATCIIMLRTTGLIASPGQFELEAGLLRGLRDCVNADGGFWKFPGAPSSPLQTGVCVAALRLALGEVAPGTRCPDWFRPNPHLEGGPDREAREMLSAARAFSGGGRGNATPGLDRDLALIARILVCHADETRRLPWAVRAGAGLSFALSQRRWPESIVRQWHFFVRAAWPALTILAADNPASNRRAQEFAGRIRRVQDATGAWELGSFLIMLNVMALAKAGANPGDPALTRAHSWILREHVTFEGDKALITATRSHVANTGYAIDTLARSPRSPKTDDALHRALGFALGAQTEDGGFAWGSRCRRDADADTTAHVLRGFAHAALRQEPERKEELRRILERGTAFMLARQTRCGGFAVVEPGRLRGRPGSMGFHKQLLFDIPTADVTARILETLAGAGLAPSCPPVRQALRSLLRTQCRNGSWWSRWWAGYLVGASFALRAYANLGLSIARTVTEHDRMLVFSHAAMDRAISFVIGRQNADGGWGETIRSDEDKRLAGVGPSTPLHTAHLMSSLLRAGYPADSSAVTRGIGYLLDAMSVEGRWNDRQATFTYFAGCLYYQYEFLNLVLPLDAVNDYLLHCAPGV